MTCPETPQASFSLLVKPAGADCNVRCEYCFYRGCAEIYPAAQTPRMTDEVLETMIRSYLATEQSQYVFGWQGGEPTLMGVDFFRRVTDCQVKYGRPGSVVANGLQTNATLLNDAMAAHLAEYRFLVGVSLDGPAEIHDRYRRDCGGQGTYARVMHGIETLRRHNVEFNILCLVSRANVDYPEAVYEHFRANGFGYLQFIPCVEFDEAGRPRPFAVDRAAWGRFLIGVFNAWRRRDAHRVSIRLFDAILSRILGEPPPICHMGRDCRQYLVVEHTGDVYPCDFFVRPALRMGNVLREDWGSLRASATYREFGEKKTCWSPRCERCEYLDYCAGDCLKHRLRTGQGDPRSASFLCEGWKAFFKETLPEFKKIASRVREARARG